MIVHLIRVVVRNRNSNLSAKLALALLGAFILNLFFGVCFYFAERNVQDELTLLDSIWWSMVTMTTVGYGDYYAQTWQGRFLVSYPCFIIGIGLIGYLLGMLAENMINLTSKRKKGISKIRMKEHTIICHCPSGTKVLNIIKELRAVDTYKEEPIVVVSDTLEECPIEFQKENISFINGNPEEIDILKKAGIDTANGVIVLAKKPGDTTSDSSTFTIVTIVEIIATEIGRDIKTTAEVINQKSNKLFDRTDVDGTVTIEGLTDKMMVQEFLHPGISQTFQQLLTNTTGSQLHTCKTRLINKSLIYLQTSALEHESQLQIIGVNRGNQQLFNPSKQTTIEEGDQLIVLAETMNDYFQFEEEILSKK